jgi:poly(A) polymerase
MPDDAPHIPDRHSDRDDALAVVRRLREAGHVAYFAGGCVRDELLGLRPQDYDVATDAPPDRVRELFRNAQAVGAAFGVILVRRGGSQVEVATFRADLAYRDGRRPEGVRFTTAEEDARRRDFTINGLFLDPLTGDVIDFVGGRADLQAKVLRAIGNPDERFAEDHLRLLRAVRFATRFRLKTDPRTDQAIRRHAAHLARISPERIAEELRAMLAPPTRTLAWALLEDYGLAAVIFRFLKLPWELPAIPPPTAAHIASYFSYLTQDEVPFGTALAAAALDYVTRRVAFAPRPPVPQLHHLLERPVVLQMVRALRQALRVSNDEEDDMQGTLDGLSMILRPRDELPTVATLKRFLARRTAPLSRALLETLAEYYKGPYEAHYHEKPWQALRNTLSELEKTDYAPPPLITGDDLTAAGLKPGPVFKRVLDEVYDAQLEGRVTSKDDALRMALASASPPPST